MSGLLASVLLIGDELLAGDIQDQNGPYFADQLTGQGFQMQGIRLLPDDVEGIAGAVREALRDCKLVVVCGGLGPTSDDRTTEGVGQALGRRLVLDEEQWERIRQIFTMLRGEEPPPGNEKQAQLPEGADALLNEMGTAFGYVSRQGDSAVAVHPEDERYKDLVGQEIILPIVGRRIPIIADDYVDPEFAEGARRFCLEEVVPVADRLDAEDLYPTELVQKAAERGYNSLTLPRAYGGGELSMSHAACMMEELSYGSAALDT